MARTGEMGYPSALTAKTWGFYDVSFKGREFEFQRPYGSYVMENVLFKISYPAEFHAQTAVEAAMTLYERIRAPSAIRLRTSARSPSELTRPACGSSPTRKGPLSNPADRDHCIQYMVAIPLIFGRLTAADYEDSVAADPRIDPLRAKMQCIEDPAYTADYHDPEKRSIANTLSVELNNGVALEETVQYPIGHRRRREEGMPLLIEKFKNNVRRRFRGKHLDGILAASLDPNRAWTRCRSTIMSGSTWFAAPRNEGLL